MSILSRAAVVVVLALGLVGLSPMTRTLASEDQEWAVVQSLIGSSVDAQALMYPAMNATGVAAINDAGLLTMTPDQFAAAQSHPSAMMTASQLFLRKIAQGVSDPSYVTDTIETMLGEVQLLDLTSLSPQDQAMVIQALLRGPLATLAAQPTSPTSTPSLLPFRTVCADTAHYTHVLLPSADALTASLIVNLYSAPRLLALKDGSCVFTWLGTPLDTSIGHTAILAEIGIYPTNALALAQLTKLNKRWASLASGKHALWRPVSLHAPLSSPSLHSFLYASTPPCVIKEGMVYRNIMYALGLSPTGQDKSSCQPQQSWMIALQDYLLYEIKVYAANAA